MKPIFVAFLLFFSLCASAQSLNQVVEDYIRKNKVPVVHGSAEEYIKNNRPFLKVDAKRKTKTLSVPHGAIAVPIPTGEKSTRDKFYSFYAPEDLVCTIYIVQHVAGKDSVFAFDGGVVKTGQRTRSDFIVDYADVNKPYLACYLLYGAVFNIPFLLPVDKKEIKINSFLPSQPVIGKDIPALLIYAIEEGDRDREQMIKKALADKGSLHIQRENRFYKRLGDYCIIYYKMDKHEK